MGSKIVVILLLLVVVGSLGSAMFYMLKDRGNSKRMVRALTIRISISIVAFILVLLIGDPNPRPF